MSKLFKKRLFQIFYNPDGSPKESLGYTRERVIEINEEYGYYDATAQLELEIGVQVNLTKDGFETSIIRDSLVDTKDFRIACITLYPLLGTAISQHADKTPTEGQIIILMEMVQLLILTITRKTIHHIKRDYGHDIALLT